MNIYTVIPARGGSKSIPEKNIRLLNGKPLLQYSIDYSLNSKLINHTIVSTDSEKIAKIASDGGAEVPFLRPSEYAQDDTPDYPVFRHALDNLEQTFNEKIDVFVLLRPTSPLRPLMLIERGIELLQQCPQATSVRSVAPSQEHPYRQWHLVGTYMKEYESQVFEPANLPRQKLPPVYFQTGDIEIIRRTTLLEGSISGEKVLPLILSPDEVVDIDYESDLQMAEQRLQDNF